MKKTTRDFRANLAHNVAAGMFETFSRKENRGANWSVDSMPRLIAGMIETQAFLYGIPKNHLEQMVMDGMEFYNRHLKSVLIELVTLQG